MEKRFEIVSKRKLNDNITWLVIKAPLVARKAKPGQFIILRTDEYGERVPLTMAGEHPEHHRSDLRRSRQIHHADGSDGSRRLLR